MKQIRFLIFFILISITYCLMSSVPSLLPPVFAATPKNTITVLPQLTQIDLSKDPPQTQIFYTNNASFTVELALSVQDVTELEDRNPVGILDPKEAANYKYSLSSWVYLDKQSLVLNPGETKQVEVTITKDKLSPGGHYGSVLAEIKASDQAKKAVKIKGVLASLLFVRAATGNEIEAAKVPFFGIENQGINFPESFIFRFQNTGNIDLTPYGTVTVRNTAGKTVAKGVVNEDSLITLPEAIRKYAVPLKAESLVLPGQYKATLSIHFGKSNKTITQSTTFITFGSSNLLRWALFGIGIMVVLVVIIKLVRSKLSPKT